MILSDLKADLKAKHAYYSQVIKECRLDTPKIHKLFCQSEDHRECGANWGHASIMLEAINRIYWCFLVPTKLPESEQFRPISCNLKNRPSLKTINYYLFSNIEEFDEDEYKWLRDIINKLKRFQVITKSNEKHKEDVLKEDVLKEEED